MARFGGRYGAREGREPRPDPRRAVLMLDLLKFASRWRSFDRDRASRLSGWINRRLYGIQGRRRKPRGAAPVAGVGGGGSVDFCAFHRRNFRRQRRRDSERHRSEVWFPDDPCTRCRPIVGRQEKRERRMRGVGKERRRRATRIRVTWSVVEAVLAAYSMQCYSHLRGHQVRRIAKSMKTSLDSRLATRRFRTPIVPQRWDGESEVAQARLR